MRSVTRHGSIHAHFRASWRDGPAVSQYFQSISDHEKRFRVMRPHGYGVPSTLCTRHGHNNDLHCSRHGIVPWADHTSRAWNRLGQEAEGIHHAARLFRALTSNTHLPINPKLKDVKITIPSCTCPPDRDRVGIRIVGRREQKKDVTCEIKRCRRSQGSTRKREAQYRRRLCYPSALPDWSGGAPGLRAAVLNRSSNEPQSSFYGMSFV